MIPLPLVLAACLMLSLAPLLFSEPQFSASRGYSCAQCHVNRTGGGMRNAFGRIFSRTEMGGRPRRPSDAATLPADTLSMLEAGADLRAAFCALFDPSPAEGFYFSEFRLQEARLYGRASPLRRHVSVVLDLSLSSKVLTEQALVREAFVMWESPGLSWHAKAGRFYQPFGIRLSDDAAYTRQATGFNFDNSDIGVEAGVDKPFFNAAVSVTNGSQGRPEDNRGKNACARAEICLRGIFAGGSLSYNRDDGNSTERTLGGPALGWHWGRLSLLSETDWILDHSPAGDIRRLAALVEGDFLVRSGLFLKVEHSYYDEALGIAHNGRTLTRYGAEYTPFPYVQFRLFYDDFRFVPQNLAGNRDQVFLEAHAFF